MLTPSIGSCLNPSTISGGVMFRMSYSVGAMSFTWWNCGRGVLSALMRFVQEMAKGVRVPPKSPATSFMKRNGESPAQAQAA